RISQRRGGAEVAVSRFAAGSEEMDHAHSSLARSAEPLHNSVAGTDASPGESRIMKTQNASKSLGRGRGTTPFPCTPSPKTKPGRLHKRIDTPGERALDLPSCRLQVPNRSAPACGICHPRSIA